MMGTTHTVYARFLQRLAMERSAILSVEPVRKVGTC